MLQSSRQISIHVLLTSSSSNSSGNLSDILFSTSEFMTHGWDRQKIILPNLLQETLAEAFPMIISIVKLRLTENYTRREQNVNQVSSDCCHAYIHSHGLQRTRLSPLVHTKREISSLSCQYSSRNSSCMPTLSLGVNSWIQRPPFKSDNNFVQLVIRRILIWKCTAYAIRICTDHAAAGNLLRDKKRKEKKRCGSTCGWIWRKPQPNLHKENLKVDFTNKRHSRLYLIL